MNGWILAGLLGFMVAGAWLAGDPDEFDAEHWLAEQEMICESLERGWECAQ